MKINSTALNYLTSGVEHLMKEAIEKIVMVTQHKSATTMLMNSDDYVVSSNWRGVDPWKCHVYFLMTSNF